MQKVLGAFLWLELALAQSTVAPSAAPTYGSGFSTDCVKQTDSNPCPRPYDFTPVGDFAFFSCGADGYARCRYNSLTASVIPGTCSLQTSPCGLEPKIAPTYDFSSALGKYAYFSCDVDYYRCNYEASNGTTYGCVKRVSPCPFSVEAFSAVGNAGLFACGADGYYECYYNTSTGIVSLETCVQKQSPCAVTHDLSVTIPHAYFSCGEGGLFKCAYSPNNTNISSTCIRAASPCSGNVKRTYSFSTQGNWGFVDCYNDGYYKCKYNTPPVWNVTGPCVVSANCVTSANFPENYDGGEYCTITPLTPVQVHFEDFFTESNYDVLEVNGKNYSGPTRPSDQNVSVPIRWSSDSSLQRPGWKFCGIVPSSPAAPSQPSTSSPSVRVTFPTPLTSLSSGAPTAMAQTLVPSLSPTPAELTDSPTFQPTGSPTPKPTGSPSLVPTSSPTTQAPTIPTPPATHRDTAGIVISIILIIALCGLLAASALFWWRKSRKAATVSPDDVPPSPRPTTRVREEIPLPPIDIDERSDQTQYVDNENDAARGSTTIEML